MKNKILNKIILFVVFVSFIISAMVLPSFAYTTNPVANTYYRYNDDFGDGVDFLVLPGLNFTVAPSSVDPGNTDLFNTLSANIPAINYSRSVNYDYSVDFVESGYSDDYYSFGFIMNYDRGRVYDNIDFLGDNFVGVMNDNNIVNGISYPLYYNEGSYISSISAQNVFLNNSYYSGITFTSNVGSGQNVVFDYGLEYFDTDINDFVYTKVTSRIDPVVNDDGTYTYSLYLAPSYYIPSLLDQSVVLIKSLYIDFSVNQFDPIMLFGDGVKTYWDIRLACSYASYYGIYLQNELNSMSDAFYNSGYQQGLNDGLSSLTPFEAVLSAVNSFITWEFIPGVSIGLVLSVVVGASLLIIFLKFFAGG